MEEMIKNPYALFAENQETYEEAVKKSTDESQSFQRTKHFTIAKSKNSRPKNKMCH